MHMKQLERDASLRREPHYAEPNPPTTGILISKQPTSSGMMFSAYKITVRLKAAYFDDAISSVLFCFGRRLRQSQNKRQ